jgi:hypothetical protein
MLSPADEKELYHLIRDAVQRGVERALEDTTVKISPWVICGGIWLFTLTSALLWFLLLVLFFNRGRL